MCRNRSSPRLTQLRTCILLLLGARQCLALLPCNFTSTEEALDYCSQFEDLYEAIDSDLQPWRDLGGISQALMKRAALTYTTINKQKGLMMGFKDGKAYVIDVTLEAGWLGHHANIFFTYMRVMLELEQLFGAEIPDVEFVVATSDRPMVLKSGILPAFTQRGLLAQGHDLEAEEVIEEEEADKGNSGTQGRNGSWAERTSDRLDGSSNVEMHLVRGDTSAGSRSRADHSERQAASGLNRAAHQATGSRSNMGGIQAPHNGSRIMSGGPAHGRTMEGGSNTPGSTGTSQGRHLHGKPARQADPSESHPMPIMRFCSSAGHYDIHIPIFHFYTKKYTQRLLSQVAAVNAKYPWEKRQPILFGRFSNYFRHVHPAVNATSRRGANNTRICVIDNPNTMTCKVRQHLFEVAALYPGQLDIRSGPHLAMLEHARYKYLVHVDGQALSSRLEQLLPLGSLVFKEQSGYTAFFHHLLKPYKHYVPFWTKTPEDALKTLEWAKSHDDEARSIGAAGQAFALKYLHKRARTCYWFHLLSRFAKLLTYKPEPGGGALGKPWMHVQQYFDTVAKPFENGRWYMTRIEQ